MGTAPDNERKESVKLFLLWGLPCLASAVSMILYLLDILPNLAVVNVICIALAILELTCGFIEGKNRYKACLFAGAVLISALTVYVNVRLEAAGLESITQQKLSMWSKAFLIFLVISVVSFLVILIRLFHWSQEEWDRAKALAQRLRREMRETRAEQAKADKQHRADMAAEQRKHEKNIQSAKDAYELSKTEARYKDEENRWKSNNPSRRREQIYNVFFKIVLPCAIAAAFFTIPACDKIRNGISSWLDKVSELIEKLFGEDTVNSGLTAILNYLLLFTFATGMVAVLVVIVLQISGKNFKGYGSRGTGEFSEKYSTPIAILVVAWAALMVLTRGGANIFNVSDSWGNLFLSILFILIVLTSVEIVRIVLDQCIEADSLLGNLLRLIFVAVMEFFVNLILGVIINFRIDLIISSLVVLVFPQDNEEFQDRINYILKILFFKELDSILDTPDQKRKFRNFRRRHIWRRRKK